MCNRLDLNAGLFVCLLACLLACRDVQVIERILLAYVANVKAGVPMAVVFTGDGVPDSAVEQPSTPLWLLLIASKVHVPGGCCPSDVAPPFPRCYPCRPVTTHDNRSCEPELPLCCSSTFACNAVPIDGVLYSSNTVLQQAQLCDV